MSAIELRTLGTLDLRAADGRELYSLLAQPKRIALLAYLCIAQPRGFHRRDTARLVLAGLGPGARTDVAEKIAPHPETIARRGHDPVAWRRRCFGGFRAHLLRRGQVRGVCAQSVSRRLSSSIGATCSRDSLWMKRRNSSNGHIRARKTALIPRRAAARRGRQQVRNSGEHRCRRHSGLVAHCSSPTPTSGAAQAYRAATPGRRSRRSHPEL